MSIAELQVQTQNISTALQYLSKRVDSLDPPNPDTPGEQDFLKKGAADKLYLSIQSAQSDYLLKTDAENDYLTQLDALTEYMPIDGAFRYFPPCTYYDENDMLKARKITHNPYSPLKMFFQQITRAINKLEIVVVKNIELYNKIMQLFE